MFGKKLDPLYRVEKSFSLWGMTKLATTLMSSGQWTPQGGIIKSWGIYYQAFIKTTVKK